MRTRVPRVADLDLAAVPAVVPVVGRVVQLAPARRHAALAVAGLAGHPLDLEAVRERTRGTVVLEGVDRGRLAGGDVDWVFEASDVLDVRRAG